MPGTERESSHSPDCVPSGAEREKCFRSPAYFSCEAARTVFLRATECEDREEGEGMHGDGEDKAGLEGLEA